MQERERERERRRERGRPSRGNIMRAMLSFSKQGKSGEENGKSDRTREKD